MTPLPSPQTSGKRPGKQIRGGLGFWGSKRTRAVDPVHSEFMRSPEAVDCDSFGAIPMPEAAAGPLQHASCCFPHASPVSSTGSGKQKTAPRDRSKPLISMRQFGAGEGIRTLDPNLGKGLEVKPIKLRPPESLPTSRPIYTPEQPAPLPAQLSPSIQQQLLVSIGTRH